ncbi:MAG: hypothetical protein QM426_08340 [Euryarchaeota archaeon]|nr:hypothetical protein [Euryarchaeota archaeon]
MIKKIKISAMFMALLLLSIAFAPAVTAQAESQNKEYADATENPNKVSVSEEDIKKAMEKANETSKSMKVLKETDKEKIVSFKKDDGSIAYMISWADEKNPNRTNFAFVDQSELASKKLVPIESLNDDSVVAEAISVPKINFWDGSYLETYGSTTTGGVHIHFSAKDGLLLAGGAGTAAILLGIILDGPLPYGDAIGILVAYGIATFYWMESNSDNSIDVRILYANALQYPLTGHVSMKIGSYWYTI